MNIEEKKKLVESYSAWWHSIDFGDGVISKGSKGEPNGFDLCTSEAKTWFPEDFFQGKRVLDIGAWDGFFSFYAERNGASEVVAVDRFIWEQKRNGQIMRNGFEIARKALNSKVKDYIMYVEDMSSSVLGTFDSIIFAGVFYHLKDPFIAVERINELLNKNGRVLVETVVSNTETDVPLMQFTPKKSLGNDSTNFWMPNFDCIRLMFKEVGDYHVENIFKTDPSRGFMVLRKV
jgi:tRNA (mo5U34)-methyltransferase